MDDYERKLADDTQPHRCHRVSTPRYVDACVACKQAPSDWEPLLRFFLPDRPAALGARLDALVRPGCRTVSRKPT